MLALDMRSLAGVLHEGAGKLRRAGIESAALDARLLLSAAVGLSHEALVARGQEPVTPEAAATFDGYIARRLAREPVARILGEKEFWGHSFKLGPATLVPRPDSECIVAAALDAALDMAGGKSAPLRILDLGTGTGCLLLSLLSELPDASGVGADISVDALEAAHENAVRLGLADRVSFVESDWADAVEEDFDLIVSNPPYVLSAELAELSEDVRLYDPRRTLDGGPDGLDCYRKIIGQIPAFLRSGGTAVLETSPDLYTDLFELIATTNGLGTPTGIKDLAGRWRGLGVAKADLER